MGMFYAAYSNSSLSTPLHKNHSQKYQNCCRWTSSKSLKLTYPCRCISSISTTKLCFPCSDISSRAYSLSKYNSFKVRAVSEEEDENAVVAAAAAAAAAAIRSEWGSSLQLVAMFGVWYSLNIYFNIYNKQVLLLLHWPFNL